MIKKMNRFLEYLLSKYEDKFSEDVLDFANHHFSLLKEHLYNDRKFISEIELSDLNPITVYIDPCDGDAIEFDVIFNPTFDCYCEYGRHHDYETEEVSDIWLAIPGNGTLSKGLTDLRFEWCKQYDKSKPKKPLEGNCIPLINRNQYDDRASEILNKYYPEYAHSSKPIDMNLLAERMGLTVLYHSISADGKSFGRVIFEDAECELYDADSEQIIKKKLSRNTIILDTHATSFFHWDQKKSLLLMK